MKDIILCISTDPDDCIPDSELRTWYDSMLSSNESHVFVANDCQFTELRIGVMLGEIAPWSFKFEGETIECGKDGRLNNWPRGMFTLMDRQLQMLMNSKHSKIRDY